MIRQPQDCPPYVDIHPGRGVQTLGNDIETKMKAISMPFP